MAPPGNDDRDRYQFITVGAHQMLVPDPPSDLARWLYLHDGRIVVDSPTPTSPDDAAFTVTRIGLDGDTVYSRRLVYQPIAYTSEDLDTIAARGARGGHMPIGAGPTAESDAAAGARALRAAMQFPQFKPAVWSVWLGADERF